MIMILTSNQRELGSKPKARTGLRKNLLMILLIVALFLDDRLFLLDMWHGENMQFVPFLHDGLIARIVPLYDGRVFSPHRGRHWNGENGGGHGCHDQLAHLALFPACCLPAP